MEHHTGTPYPRPHPIYPSVARAKLPRERPETAAMAPVDTPTPRAFPCSEPPGWVRLGLSFAALLSESRPEAGSFRSGELRRASPAATGRALWSSEPLALRLPAPPLARWAGPRPLVLAGQKRKRREKKKKKGEKGKGPVGRIPSTGPSSFFSSGRNQSCHPKSVPPP